ncbi:MAG: NADPH:quinone oxidoreductase family protein [Hyphomicrobiaceae bacterium]|nr:NADPH:quinone oxidoreductase family protein [Hyphomicrobiaceae bacterium]
MANVTYRAVVCDTLGPPDQLVLRLLTRQPLGPRQVRLAVRAAGLNFPDVLMVQGLYQHKPDLPFVPGMEAAGVIVELGEDVADLAIGQRVIARLRTGAFAEEAVVSEGDVVPVPEGFTDVEAATLLVAHVTAYHALATRARTARGDTLLVLGAGGGVGLAAVEVGCLLGASVIAVASSEPKRAAAKAKGAAHVLDPAAGRLADAVKALTDGNGADIVLDPVGLAGDEALRCVAFGGRLLVAGFAAGSIPAYAANRILLKGASVLGIRAGEAARRDPDLRAQETRQVMAWADSGRVRPFVSATCPLAQVAKAMHLLSEREAVGRVALTMG